MATVWPTGLSVGASLFLLLSSGLSAAAETPKVVVTIKPIHALVTEVMEGVGTPTLLITGSASPHTFSLRPSTARAINEADVFVRISDSLEPFTRKIVQALPPSVTVVTLADSPSIALLDRRQGGTFEPHVHAHLHSVADHSDHEANGDGDDDDASGKDGHIWLDPQNAKAIVGVVSKVLSARYPEYADKFAANASALDRRLDALDQELATELNGARHKPFVVFHDSTQYLENRFGLNAAGSITISPDVPPSARRLTDVHQKIASIGAICVFSEPSFQPSLVAAVTEGTKARTGTLDTEGLLLAPGPDLYFTLMRGLAHNLVNCLDAQS
jgi:zinc transport system substrate-binding protein